MQIRILQDVHYTAWLLDPNLCPVDVTEHLPAFERHINVYLAGAKREIDDHGRQKLAKAMSKKCKSVHQYWGTLKRGEKNKEVIESFGGYAARYWEDNTPAQSVSEHGHDPVAVDLEAFAVNALSLCPSSCATEWSFSHQGRIHTKQRNRLAPEVVRNLLFCKWNARVLRNLDRVQTFDQKRDCQKMKLGTLFPYEDFFNKPAFSSIFTDNEARSILDRIHRKESRMRTEIEASRKWLYQDSAVYIFATTRGESRIARAISVPALPHSAPASIHDRSTTLGDYSARPSSPTVREGPRRFRANTREELSQLLSATKKASARRRPYVGSGPEGLPISDVYSAGEDVQEFERNRNDLRDEDNITISVSTARQLLGNQLSQRQAPTDVPYSPAQPSQPLGQPMYTRPEPQGIPSLDLPTYVTPHPPAQPPYLATNAGGQPPYLATHAEALPMFLPSLSHSMPMQAGRQSTGFATHYPQYVPNQQVVPTDEPTRAERFRRSSPGRGSRGRPPMSYQNRRYPQPGPIQNAQQADLVADEDREDCEDELDP